MKPAKATPAQDNRPTDVERDQQSEPGSPKLVKRNKKKAPAPTNTFVPGRQTRPVKGVVFR